MPQEPEVKPTEEKQLSSEDMINLMIDALPDPSQKRKQPDPPEKKEEVVDEKEEPEKKEEAPVKETPKEESGEKEPEPEPEPEKDDDDEADRLEAAADRIEAASKKLEREDPPEKKVDEPAPGEPALSAKEKRKLEVFEELERSNPDDYKGVAGKYKQAVDKWSKYRKKWEDENPDSEFDPQSEEHDEFYDKTFPKVDDFDMIDAAASLKARKTQEESERRAEEKRAAEEAKKTIESSVKKATEDSAKEIIKELNGEEATLDDLKKSDPGMHALARSAINDCKALTKAAVELLTPGTTHRAIEGNPVHEELISRVEQFEEEIAKLPKDKRMNGNKLFATLDEYKSLPDSEKSKRWVLWNKPEFVTALIRDSVVSGFTEDAKAIKAQRQSAPSSQKASVSEKTTEPAPAKKEEAPPSSMASATKRQVTGEDKPSGGDRFSFMDWRT